uniref:Uncharacterized protein n=2 Tax=Caenorhabditis japonica TaxID=281687 RepID=A0A8R1HL13_CAEJA
MMAEMPARSMSASDGESSDAERRLRRSRRKRGGQRVRPYAISPENFAVEKKPVNKRKLRDRRGMAPPNSTQFLLDDREERANAEYENEQKFEAAERRRIRSLSGSFEQMRHAFSGATTIEPATTTTTIASTACGSGSGCGTDAEESVSGESEADREMEREFETDYLEVKRERIQSMTRSQLAQELLERDQDTQLLTQELDTMDAENRHLRRLLTAHGIHLESPPDDVTSSGAPCVDKSPVIA